MWFGETPSSSIVCNGHLAAPLMPISAYAGQAMARWPPAPQAIMFGFTQWKGLIGSAHVPDWTCFTPVGLHRIKGSLSPLGTIIRTRRNTHTHTETFWTHTAIQAVFLNLMFLWVCILYCTQWSKHTHIQNQHHTSDTHTPIEKKYEHRDNALGFFYVLMHRHKCMLACTQALCK